MYRCDHTLGRRARLAYLRTMMSAMTQTPEHGAGIELGPERYFADARIKCSLLGYDRWPMALVGVKVVTLGLRTS